MAQGPGNDNASSSGIELATLERGYDAGRMAARHLDQLSEVAMPRDRSDAWRVAGHWLERRRMEAREKPRPQHHRDVPLVRSLLSSGLFSTFRAGYMAGLCAALNERYKATPMSQDEATWMGIARGHAMVYGRTWPRAMPPSRVSSEAISAAVNDTTGASDAGVMAEVSRQGQAFLRGVSVGAAEGAETYLKHSGRGHLRVVTAPISADAPPPKRRRKKPVLKRVLNGRAGLAWKPTQAQIDEVGKLWGERYGTSWSYEVVPLGMVEWIDFRDDETSELDRKGGLAYAQRIAEAMQRGESLPPAVGYRFHDRIVAHDGNHRITASRLARRGKGIPMIVYVPKWGNR